MTTEHAAAPGTAEHKVITFIVNLATRTSTEKEISFENLLAIAFPALVVTPTTYITVTFRRGQGHKPEGSLISGESVNLKEGMVFSVVATDKS